MLLTRDEIFALDDITVKEITVPDTIPVWGGKVLKIKQLTRGMQDAYNKRQFGSMAVKQDGMSRGRKNGANKANGAKETQEIYGMSIYGHDAWLCVRGICNADGKPMFTDNDIEKLNEKSGEAIGWIASEIVKFSNMANDDKVAKGEMSAEESLAEEIKN